ncbi:MAG: hypothetical protein QXS85_00145 [Acidilobaceae archaeon]
MVSECSELPLRLFGLITRLREAYGINVYLEVVDRGLLFGASSSQAVVSAGSQYVILECSELSDSTLESIEVEILRAIAAPHLASEAYEDSVSLAGRSRPHLESAVEVGD